MRKTTQNAQISQIDQECTDSRAISYVDDPGDDRTTFWDEGPRNGSVLGSPWYGVWWNGQVSGNLGFAIWDCGSAPLLTKEGWTHLWADGVVL